MALKQGITFEVPVPHESGQWLRFRELDLTELTAAKQAQDRIDMAAQRDRVQVMGKDVVKELADIYANQASQKSDTPAATPDPVDVALKDYDAATLLRLAVVAWSYEAEEPTDPIRQLDAHTATWAVRQIVAHHIVSGPEAEEERGNGYSPSTLLSTG